MAESLWRPGHVVSAIAIMGATAVLVAMFNAMGTPSAPKPPRPLAEIQADMAATRAQDIQNCIQTSFNEHSSNALSVKDQTDIAKGCADAIGAATDGPIAAVASMAASQPAGQVHGAPAASDPNK